MAPAVVPGHLKWLRPIRTRLKLQCGTPIEALRLEHKPDDETLSEWAKHFRQNYCLDEHIDILREGTGLSRRDYLLQLKFPSTTGFGPSVRAGDFTELLLADYLEYTLGYTVPRLRWCTKDVTDESKKGCDVFGFKFAGSDFSPDDELLIIECKSKFTPGTAPPVQRAINDSSKDEIRIAFNLHACVERAFAAGNEEEMKSFQRFQNPLDRPYKRHYRAAAAICDSSYEQTDISDASAVDHVHTENLKIIVIKGSDLMALTHHLFERAAREA